MKEGIGAMADVQRTLAIVKPDAAGKPGVTGQILARIEERGLSIVGLKKIQLTEEDARGFYAVHRERPFYGELVEFMTSGPVVVVALEGDDAIQRWRDLMGPTDAAKAEPGTIRGDFGTDIERNASHGSDAPETAKAELAYFFNAKEILGQVEAL
jgi:nucleoside-diphosphate kinase